MDEQPEVPYLVLHPMGFTVPLGSLRERWALTPPFHPYPPKKGGLFSAALAVKASSQTPCPRVSNPEDPLRGIVPCGVRTFLTGKTSSDSCPFETGWRVIRVTEKLQRLKHGSSSLLQMLQYIGPHPSLWSGRMRQPCSVASTNGSGKLVCHFTH